MNTEHLRNLKHELRTPVNHILGYSDLLLESADDVGDATIVGLAVAVRSIGQVLARLLENSLGSINGEVDKQQINALCYSIRPVIGQILEVLPPDPEEVGANSFDEDIERIRKAANQLLSLTEIVQE